MGKKTKSREEAIIESPLYGIKKPCKIVSDEGDLYNVGEIGIVDNILLNPLSSALGDLSQFKYDEENQFLIWSYSNNRNSAVIIVDLGEGVIYSQRDGSTVFCYMPMTEDEIKTFTPWYVKLWRACPAWSWYLSFALLVLYIILIIFF